MLRREGDGRHERIAKVTLRLIGGPHAGLVVAFTGDRIEGGRGPANDLVLRDTSVSQSHFELELGRDGVCLRDLGSTNGTWLGPVRVSEIWIPEKTVFTVGQTDIELKSTRRMRVPVSKVDQLGPLRGRSTVMRELFVSLERLAETDLDVLLEGEVGTGKRLAAEALHKRSRRSGGPLVVFDCGEREPPEIEAALFGLDGHEAELRRRARGGTLVLRQIGDLPMELQPRLLEWLECRDAARESGDLAASDDVRLLFVSSLSLRMLAAEGLLYEPLYKKIADASVRVPPLRERSGDAVYLFEHFLVDLAPDRIVELAPDAARALPLHPFPGNVRELYNVAIRALARTTGSRITRRDLALGDMQGFGGLSALAALPLRDARERFVRRYFAVLHRETEGNLAEMARRSGSSPSTVRRLLADVQQGHLDPPGDLGCSQRR
ncbi:sigma-54-dependent Fis family transcriptional regulator [Paraliomyxa miuraensis]|uniref:sigma-54-dependent Fis family transcriptional regulator n=1 Tax=Paraliomyxa miuraensis TaxID=376150 RepID=UPI00224C9BDA|nr:sigma 54-interacting transcriptional regulator [Paraliomyxa miuraensis]MCX4239634.1 sigma 54-interacting transcriptional regulator [Paraliomyxa miuraensis]